MNLTAKDLKIKIADTYKLIKDFEKLFKSAFDLKQKCPLNLQWTGDDLKIQRLRATENTIKEMIDGEEWERHNNLLELLILKIYQMGYQNGQIVTANEYEDQFDEVIKNHEEMEKFGGYTEKGKIMVEHEIELCQRLSLKHRDTYYKRLSNKLKNPTKEELQHLDDLLIEHTSKSKNIVLNLDVKNMTDEEIKEHLDKLGHSPY